MSYFTKEQTTMLKNVLNGEEDIPLQFKNEPEITGKFAEKYNSFKNCTDWSQFIESGGKFADAAKCIKNGYLEIDFNGWDDCEKVLVDATMRAEEQAKKKEEEKVQKALQKVEDKKAREALKEANKLDRQEAKKVAKRAKEFLKEYNTTVKKAKIEHKKNLKSGFKDMKKIAKMWLKKSIDEQKATLKAKKAAAKEAKELEKAEKKAAREAKKAEKEAKKAQKEETEKDDSDEEHDFVEGLKVADLKKELEKRGCDDVTGKKADLKARLLELLA